MLKTLAILFMLTAALAGSNVVLQPPLGLDLYMPVPEANPLTRAKVELGRKLFFDKRLSRNYTVACASCHDPRLAFTDGRPTAVDEGRFTNSNQERDRGAFKTPTLREIA